MTVYHGSYVEIALPDISHSREKVDFGRAFYVTPIKEQAEKWAERFGIRGMPAVVSSYQLDEKALSGFKVKRFKKYSEDWLDFITSCRLGNDDTDFDVVVGGVANDKVFNTIELYFKNLIGKKEAIKRLKYEKPNIQIAFRTQKVIDECLRFIGSDAQ